MDTFHHIIGIDEAGRGAWAGPLVVSGIRISRDDACLDRIVGLADSKRLPPQRRAEIYEQLQSLDVHGSICAHTVIQAVETIDTLGIREANRRAMHEILLALTPTDERVTVRIDGADNFYFPGYPCGYTWAKKAGQTAVPTIPIESSSEHHITYIIRGDASEKIIAAASILAKVTRDRLMVEYAASYPEYHFEAHKGYGTQDHHRAIIHYGIKSIHRKTYAPIKRLISGENGVL